MCVSGHSMVRNLHDRLTARRRVRQCNFSDRHARPQAPFDRRRLELRDVPVTPPLAHHIHGLFNNCWLGVYVRPGVDRLDRWLLRWISILRDNDDARGALAYLCWVGPRDFISTSSSLSIKRP